MSKFKSISLIAATMLVTLAIIAAFKPDTFRVERAITIKAPAEKIFPLINDLHNFPRWSPYEKRDPAMQRTFSGTPAGVGASYAWAGNNDVGEGQMTIRNVLPNARIIMQLDFLRPMEAHNSVEFLLAAQGSDSTRVSWAIEGPMPYTSKLMSLFFSFDAMIGKDFEDGLANLQKIAEQ